MVKQLKTFSKLKVLSANVDSLTSKLEEMLARVECYEPDIICLQEVLPKNNKDDIDVDLEYKIEGYTMYYPTIMKRGVVTYVKKGIQAHQVEIDNKFEESVWCAIRCGAEQYILGNLYRSPNSNSENNAKLCSMINEVSRKEFDSIVICGDLNMREIDWAREVVNAPENSVANMFFECLQDNMLFQQVTETTRHREGQASSLLDLVITDQVDSVCTLLYEAPIGKSDHVCIVFEVVCNREEDTQRLVRKYHKGNYDEIRNDIRNVDWQKELSDKDIDEAWTFFEKMMVNSIDKNVPLGKIGHSFKKKWMTREVLEIVKEKHRAYRKLRKQRTEENKRKYQEAKGKALSSTRKARIDFECRIAKDVKVNPKEFYNYCNGKMTTRGEISVITTEEGEKIYDEQEIAEKMNESFTSVFTIRDVHHLPEKEQVQVNEQLVHIGITEDRVRRMLMEQKPGKSAGPDGIHARVVSEAREELVIPLTIIFKKSLANGVIPEAWKKAEVVPIYKKGRKDIPLNYRPVSLTSVIGKILEKMIREEIMNHLDRNNLIHTAQHGFVRGRSCQTQLLLVTEEWTKWMEEKKTFDCVYMDYRKAFDSVPHCRLLNKLEAYGIAGKVLKWLGSFLDNRKQRVRVGKGLSDWKKVTSGVPQGSVLGPTLFVIFIDDLPSEVESTVALFADDTKMYRVVQSEDDHQALQRDINKLEKWSRMWQLPFNTDKCKIMHYGRNNPQFEYRLGRTKIKAVTEEKDLGVIFDPLMDFSSNACKTAAVGNARLSLIKKNFKHLGAESFMMLYKTIVRPRLEYCMPVAQPRYKKDAFKIEQVQRRATRLIETVHNEEYPVRLERLNLPSLEFRRKRASVLQAFRIVKGIDRLDEKIFFERNQETRTRGHSQKFQEKFCRSEARKRAFSQRAVRDWNRLPEAVIDSDTVNQFKRRLGRWWKDEPTLYMKHREPVVTRHSAITTFNDEERGTS